MTPLKREILNCAEKIANAYDEMMIDVMPNSQDDAFADARFDIYWESRKLFLRDLQRFCHENGKCFDRARKQAINYSKELSVY